MLSVSRLHQRILLVIIALFVVHTAFSRFYDTEPSSATLGPLSWIGLPLASSYNTHQSDKQNVLEPANEIVRENATLVTLARSSDLADLMNTIRSVEDRFNSKYHYDWVFLNNEPFTEEFIKVTSHLISGKTRYGTIDYQHWSYPDFINQNEAAAARQRMKENGIIYGDSESYRHMCRFESGFFFHHHLMQDYKYYWRVEPSTLLHCNIDYDVFKFMRENGKKYGFTISLREFQSTIASLWHVTKQFVDHFPEYINPNSLMSFISDDQGASYNLCHFWSNFEVGDMDFWRGDIYSQFFQFLDSSGGFFYERWGDAPVHSIAASLFMDKEEIHLFDDIGYTHPPFTHCPLNPSERNLTCSCLPQQNFDWSPYSCMTQYYSAQNMTLPDEVRGDQ
jgi:alpha 1,2-mannosyltransferase